MLAGLTLAIWMAVSSSAALPEPLSLMPAPSWTESRCAPAMTTLSSLPERVSAITLYATRVSSSKFTVTVTFEFGTEARLTPAS